ncbi:MAG TPA: division/cell wall cluster transcriptional repressor MraZ [Alphaproteobacteria bacterium]|nr:division/cell wall cluster transcriptional repressor MraZ [Alphaproteobacteria bacterium]
MALFLSTYLNKIDRKGRVSVPAQFRAAVAGQAFNGVVLWRSPKYPALDGCDWARMEQLSASLDSLDMFSDAQDDLATTMFGSSVPLPFDGEGRIVLPADLVEFAGLGEQVAFVGLGKTFQMWEPAAFAQRQAEARERARSENRTLKVGGAP